jgi:catechol 2,3-dioxygenase-like lactoylglutathione lyase family enzyme
MTANRRATAMIPASDFARAKRWYADKLGLKPVEEMGEGGAAYVLGGGTRAFLYPTQFAGTAQHTLLSFDTPDLAADMAALRSKGVAFIDYDLPGLKTENGVASFGLVKNAWCKDSEGNILGFVQGMWRLVLYPLAGRRGGFEPFEGGPDAFGDTEIEILAGQALLVFL